METTLIETGKKRSRKDLMGDADKNSDEAAYKNLCIACNVDMGEDNPRQLCGKTKCLYQDMLQTNDYEAADNVDESDTFISEEEFEEAVEREKPIKWIALDQDKIY